MHGRRLQRESATTQERVRTRLLVYNLSFFPFTLVLYCPSFIYPLLSSSFFSLKSLSLSEHLIPLMVVAGAAHSDHAGKVLYDEVVGAMGLQSYVFEN